jgi:REP element-mobilizing transposase RayT
MDCRLMIVDFGCLIYSSSCRVSRQAVQAASRSLSDDAANIQINWDKVNKDDATLLPHWKIDGGIYAVTFRLADSLPTEVLNRYREARDLISEKIEILSKLDSSRSQLDDLLSLREELNHLETSIIEPALNQGHGTCLFKNEQNAELLANALKHFDGTRYDLLAWCIMPNHVHVIHKPAKGEELDKILHSWKSYTSHEINKLNGTSGSIWQKESYDHLIRDGKDLRNQIDYILNNPTKAGYTNWLWTGCAYPELLARRQNHGLPRDAAATSSLTPSYDPFSYERRCSSPITIQGHELGGEKTVRVFTTQANWNALAHKIAGMGDFKPEIIYEKAGVLEIDPRDDSAISALNDRTEPTLITVADHVEMEPIHAFRMLAFQANPIHPILLKDTLQPPSEESDFLTSLLTASKNIGSLLCDGIGDAVLIRGETAPGQSLRIAYNILQAAGTRIFKTDYVACPSCGRTLFNLQSTTQKIRAATGHLKGVRIAVMGCIVNGPGEMADADFGYVGGAPGKINLYVGKTPVKFNIPEDEAVNRLIDLIKEHDKWIDAPTISVSAD